MRLPLASPVVAVAVLVAAACGGAGGEDREGGRPPKPPERTATASPPPASTPAAPRATGAAWTRARVRQRLDGRRIRVRGRAVRLDAATLTCGGLGRPRRGKGGAPAWTRFRCVQPTFPPGQVVGPDLVLTVRPTGRTAFTVVERHLTRY